MNPERGHLSSTAKNVVTFLILGLIVVCGIGGYFAYKLLIAPQPTAAPAVAQSIPQQPTVVIPPTKAAAVQPTSPKVVEPTKTSVATVAKATPENTAAPSVSDPAAGLPEFTVALDAFAPYYDVLLAKQRGLDAKWGINLKIVPFCSTDDNCFGEAERTEMLKSGTWDALFTTIDKPSLHPDMGVITQFIDETDGADKLVCNKSVKSLNDLSGKKISYLSESVGEYIVYYALNMVTIPVSDVALMPKDSVADAVKEVISGNADCVSGWEPDVNEALKDGNTWEVFNTHKTVREALDVGIISHNANDNRKAETQAFHNMRFEAQKYLLESPADAEKALITYLGANNLDGDKWSFVAQPGDWLNSLGTTPQATLTNNVVVFRNLKAIAEREANDCRVWKWAGFDTGDCAADKFYTGLNPEYVQKASQLGELATTAKPINKTFLFTSIPVAQQLTEQQIQSAEVVATLPLEKIPFQSNSYKLTAEGAKQLAEKVLPVLKTSPDLRLRLTGSAALPAGGQYTLKGTQDFALKRAQEVGDFLENPRASKFSYLGYDLDGIDPDTTDKEPSNRIVYEISDPTYPQSADPALLEKDRFVRFELLTIGY